MAPESNKSLQLPSQIITPGDLNRLIREVESIDDFLDQSAIRNAQETPRLPAVSKVLEEIASGNSLQLLKPEDRKTFKELLNNLKAVAPTIHLSFAAIPSPAFLNKLVTWFRTNIHPNVLLRIGLEPSIAGGCIIRTTNKQFDLSFRKHFMSEHDGLVNKLNELAGS